MSSDNHESQRLAALHRLHILDTAPDPDFDNLTKLARDCLQVPIALVSLIDLERQWFKSKVGLDVDQTPRCISFCTHAVSARQPLIIEDAKADSRFADNPLVVGDPHIRFYAGIPVHDEDGFVLGTFCVIDRQPRMLDDSQLKILKRLAGQAQQLIQLKFNSRLLQRERARYQAIVQGAAAGILRIDQSGKMLEANDYTLSLLGYRAEDVIGNNVSMLMPERWAQHHDSYVQSYLSSGEGKVIGIGREVEALHHDGHAIPVHLAVSAVKVSGQQEQEFIGILSDLSQVHQARHRERQEKLLLKVLHRGLTDYHALISENQLWVFLQEALCELTGSEYSLIGEVCEGSGSPALKVHAMTDLSWSAESQALMQQFIAGNMTITDPDTMLGRVFAGGEVVLSNHMSIDERAGHLPTGHPELHRYLGVPIFDRGEVIGMFAIANAEQDYSEEIIRWLQPFNSTCALLINLYRQLNHQQRLAQQLQDARDQAERANRAKTEFLSSMSHELRTPLNSILGFAQLLHNSDPDLTERQQRQAGQIISSGRHLLNLINEVLDLARIESGNMQVSLEAISLTEVMDDVIEVMRPIAAQYHIHLESVDNIDHWSVIADFTRLKQVLLNLLNNAVKYNRENGKVWMSFETLPEQRLRIKVHDTGCGISAYKKSQLFQPFNRLGAESSAIEGTGVGLALTKKLVELMNGEIGVDSEQDEGSCFWFELPMSVQSHNLSRWNPTCYIADEAPGAEFNVLYIEDNPANQRLMQEVFDGIKNCHLAMESSAETGLEHAFSHPPDLILMDIDLSGMNGFEAQERLQDHPATRDIPVFAITAGASSSQRLRAFEQGFRMFITKPFDVNELVKNILQLRNELKG